MICQTDPDVQPDWELPVSPRLRLMFVVTGVAFPGICLVVSTVVSGPGPRSPWQSGRMADYFILLMAWPTLGIFLPLILFSMGCMTAWALRPERDRMLVVRLGIYSGMPLALVFLVFILGIWGWPTLVAVPFVAIPFGLAILGGRFVLRRARRFTILHLLILTTISAVSISLATVVGWDSVAEWAFAPFFAVLPAAPTLNALTYVWAALIVARRSMAYGWEGIGWTVAGWSSLAVAWIATWKLALEVMLFEYARLPTTDPNCYVSSAAAHGHRRFVRAEQAPGSGRDRIVNDQMRRLKFLELALLAANPPLHHRVRRFYDRLGPPLAKLCGRNPWFSDLTYLGLKPLEGVAELLRFSASIPAFRIRAVYRVER